MNYETYLILAGAILASVLAGTAILIFLGKDDEENERIVDEYLKDEEEKL